MKHVLSDTGYTLRLKASQWALLAFQLLVGLMTGQTAMKTFTPTLNYCRNFHER